MAAWQSIKTAPKDGTPILVRSSGTGKWPAVASWCGTYWGYHAPHCNLGAIEQWKPTPTTSTQQ